MAKAKVKVERIRIKPADLRVITIPIVGTAPIVQHNFSQKVIAGILRKQTSTAKSTKKPPRNIEEDFEGAKHVSEDGWIGFPAEAFRAAMISACRLVGFKMTLAKMSAFVEADGLDRDSGQPLVKLIAGEPEVSKMAVRLETGVASVAIRPLWRDWGFILRIKYDADQFDANDVVNLLDRAGQQVGIGEGRPDSRKSTGLGWGTFQVDLDAMNSEKKKTKKTRSKK